MLQHAEVEHMRECLYNLALLPQQTVALMHQGWLSPKLLTSIASLLMALLP